MKVKYNVLNKAILFVGIAIFIIMLALRDFFHIDYNKYIITALIIIICLFLNYENIVKLIFFTIPLMCGIPSRSIFVVFVLFLIMKKRRISFSEMAIPLMLSIYEFFLIIANYYFTLSDYIFYVSVLFITLFLWRIEDYKHLNYHKILKYFIWGCFFVLLFILINTILNNDISSIASKSFRIGATKDSNTDGIKFSLNANSVAFYSIISVSLCLFYIREKDKKSIVYLLIMIFSCVMGLLTVSRSFILCCIILFFIDFIFAIKSVISIKKLIISIVCIIVILAIILIVNKKTNILSFVIERFEDKTVQSAGGRTEIFEAFWQWQKKHLFELIFGTGAIYYREVTDLGFSCHNGFQNIAVSYGVIGLLFFIFYWLSTLAKIKKGKKVSYYYYYPMIMFILFTQTVQFLIPSYYLASSIVCFAVFKIQQNTDMGKLNDFNYLQHI